MKISQISRLTTAYLTNPITYFASTTKRVGDLLVPVLPKIEMPFRSHHPDEPHMPKQMLYETQGYIKHDREARCNYYGLQRKGRIYHVFNAYNYPMGRMIHKIATAIRGKNSPLYRNSRADIKNGDICVIVNAADPLFTGRKLMYKDFKYHSGFVGHLKVHSYKAVLNRTPELLYYYLLRKAMPKNTVSEKYMQNVKIFRGPTHDIPHLPQFMPDRTIYENLPEMDFEKFYEENSDNVELVEESRPRVAEETFGKEFPRADMSAYQGTEAESEPKSMRPNMTIEEYKKLLRHQKRMEARHKIVRAPYKKKNTGKYNFDYIDDERKAKKMSNYDMLADEDAPEDDQELQQDPFGRKAFEESLKKDNKK